MAVRGLELRVQILVAVRRVRERMQSRPVVLVEILVNYLHFVPHHFQQLSSNHYLVIVKYYLIHHLVVHSQFQHLFPVEVNRHFFHSCFLEVEMDRLLT